MRKGEWALLNLLLKQLGMKFENCEKNEDRIFVVNSISTHSMPNDKPFAVSFFIVHWVWIIIKMFANLLPSDHINIIIYWCKRLPVILSVLGHKQNVLLSFQLFCRLRSQTCLSLFHMQTSTERTFVFCLWLDCNVMLNIYDD